MDKWKLNNWLIERLNETMKINKGAKVGFLIELVALFIMILLTLFNKTVPALLSWIFVAGLVIALSGAFTALSKKLVKR